MTIFFGIGILLLRISTILRVLNVLHRLLTIIDIREFCYSIICKEGEEMRSTGIVRRMDELGRVVIPIELRRTLNIKEKDPIEIYVDKDKIVLRKYESRMACQITGEVSDDNLLLAGGKLILSKEGALELMEEIESLIVDKKRIK